MKPKNRWTQSYWGVIISVLARILAVSQTQVVCLKNMPHKFNFFWRSFNLVLFTFRLHYLALTTSNNVFKMSVIVRNCTLFCFPEPIHENVICYDSYSFKAKLNFMKFYFTLFWSKSALPKGIPHYFPTVFRYFFHPFVW